MKDSASCRRQWGVSLFPVFLVDGFEKMVIMDGEEIDAVTLLGYDQCRPVDCRRFSSYRGIAGMEELMGVIMRDASGGLIVRLVHPILLFGASR